ncbi:MAG: hypothetical protein ACNS62_14425 [Candidatus Cyclobacteriaceae bacterium M3_2C_046]
MGFVEILLALIIAIIITVIFVIGFKNRGPWGSIWAFFLIIFLAIWAASLWVSPRGPFLYGVAWMPIAFVGVVFALIISAAAPPSNRETIQHNRKIDPELKQKTTINTFSLFFWLLLVILVVAVVFGYYIA